MCEINIFYTTFTFVIMFTTSLFYMVYKIVSIQHQMTGGSLSAKENVQKWLKGALDDQIAKILAKNSNLTKIQVETLLIDFLAENIAEKHIKMDEKARLRLKKAEISRGAFNRTLKQARKNVIQSIYTVLLLGYLGIFDSTRLDPYIEIANKLQAYVNAYKNILPDKNRVKENIRVINMLRDELERSLNALSEERTFSET